MTLSGDSFFILDTEQKTLIAETQARALKERLWWEINHPIKAVGVKSNKKPGWRFT